MSMHAAADGIFNSVYDQPPTKHDQSQEKDIHAHTLHWTCILRSSKNLTTHFQIPPHKQKC